ncbi:hypothetical protein FB567DRAFT_597219 [Paraphoma chrysanthemicola]|uniref:Uncharacterized protein n=1 Tax=Paraphoma chrysanthemicola TaxID=798071 RepID=A0A8K0VTE6_9PLEO|nr:hypothetical protein FB567DRAFT_597219 [Paraphoma chrysanthemicola]
MDLQAQCKDSLEDARAALRSMIDLRKRRAQICKTHRSIYATICKLEAELTELKAKRVELEAKRVELRGCSSSLAKSINQIAETYSRGWNRDFATKLLQSLHRELRDQVYDELAPPKAQNTETDPVKQESFIQNWHQGPASPNDDSCEHAFPIRSPPYYLDEAYVGKTFATECAERLFRATRSQQVHVDGLLTFLTRDIDRNGAYPVQYVRNLEVDLSLGLFDPIPGTITTFHPRVNFSPNVYEGRVSKLHVLKHLHCRSACITVNVLCSGLVRLRRFERALGPFVYDMRDMGFKVNVRQKLEKDKAWYDFRFHLPRDNWEVAMAMEMNIIE